MFINGENISELVFIVDLIATRVFDQNEAVLAQGRTGCRGMKDLVVVMYFSAQEMCFICFYFYQ